MPVNYTLTEPENRNYIPPRPFGLYEEGVAAHEILRLLLGSVNVRDVRNNQVVVLATNELRRGGKRLANPANISRLVLDANVTVDEYAGFVRAINASNLEFFRQLQRELTLALVAKRRARYTESFLYFYRILEFVSLAIPLIYALTQSNFRTSHAFLKALFNNDRDGDLKALQSALPHLAAAGNLSALTFDFSIAGRDVADVAALKQQLEVAVSPKVRGFEFDDQGDILFRVPFNSMPSFIINVRNRLFHYKVGEPNIAVGDIGGAEMLCEICVREIVHWFAILYSELLRTLANREI